MMSTGSRAPVRPVGLLVAMMGSKPQVVTTTIDLVLAERHSLSEVLVLHTGLHGAIDTAIQQLRHEFASYARYQSLSLFFEPFSINGVAINDVETREHASLAFHVLFRTVREHKLRAPDRPIHLSATGGRKVFAIYAMAVAQLLFGETDRLWYVSVDETFQRSERLHPTAHDRATLIDVPVPTWSGIAPIHTAIARSDDPFEAMKWLHQRGLTQDYQQARVYLKDRLSPAEREVVTRLVRDGLSDREIARATGLQPKTVSNQLASAYEKARDHWAVDEINRQHLVALLTVYLRFPEPDDEFAE